MKILQLYEFFSLARGGGTINLLCRLSQAMAQRGHEVAIYTSDLELDRELVTSIEKDVRIYPFHSWLNLLRIPLVPGLVSQIKKTLMEFDVAHLHQYRSFQNIIVWYYARKYRTPYIIHAQGSATRMAVGGWGIKGVLKWLYDIYIGKRINRDAAGLIAMTPFEARLYKELGAEETKIFDIPNSIDIDNYKPLPEKGTFRKEYGIKEENIVLYLGRIHKIKGLDKLIKAAAVLEKEGKDFRLVMIGADDGYLPVLEKLIRGAGIGNRITITGFVPFEMKLAAYVDADVYVLPSIYETFPTTVLEASICGTPVIVTDRCQIAHLVENTFGLVVPYDEDHLHDALSQMLDDEGMRIRFGEAGKKLVREKYAWQHIVEQTENLYREVITASHE